MAEPPPKRPGEIRVRLHRPTGGAATQVLVEDRLVGEATEEVWKEVSRLAEGHELGGVFAGGEVPTAEIISAVDSLIEAGVKDVTYFGETPSPFGTGGMSGR